MMCLKYRFLFLYLLQICSVFANENIQIECDSISNTDFGRRFCFIRHMNNRTFHKVTFKPNPIADEKRELIFDNCTIDALPLGFFEYFPNIRTVYAWNIKLQNVSKEAFRNGNALAVLDLSKNHIGTLVEHAFSLAKQLIELHLSKNLIQSIHVNAFSGLGQLNILNLDHNRLQLIPANCFDSLTQLKTIRLSHNSIKMIPVELFGQNVRLQDIHLNDNAIEWMFGELTFRHLSYVNKFDLHNNPNANPGCCVINAESIDIRNTNSKGCYIGSRTKQVLANNNGITFIDSNDATLANLEHIELANNRLEKMQNLTRFNKMTYLDLMNNSINDIDLTSFANMHRLEVLNLRNSGLSKIQFGMFSHKSKLKLLDISYNWLRNINFQMFVSMKSLRKLHLDGNNLNKIDAAEIRKTLPSLSKISISENDWSCHNLASIIKYLESNGIELDSVDLTKDTENIKGVPCTTDIDNSTNSEVIPKGNGIGVTSNEPDEKNYATSTPTSTDMGDKKYCDRSLDAFHMYLTQRLLELKYDIQNSIQSVTEAAKKLEYLLNLS
ncbi:leucine-rich repeat transmembrane neuronal protein 3-like [Sitodiplosis mosellana]|uniref:leucine-rich repeat transmembrane neuronal protein 3-like n=1 Tax=Sitodiplosis mosellana TaxID=263140 RepID=UPI0024443B81|nr:leucine-rich repeat transmembrane neuronal protein 3-like [Sitodiplosis mosellana]